MELSRRAPKLASFYPKYKELILAQTQYNERIIEKKGEFYSLARDMVLSGVLCQTPDAAAYQKEAVNV